MGHINPEPIGQSFVAYLYTFNVPLFFLVSGYLAETQRHQGWISNLKQKFKQILIPYLMLFLASLFYGHIVVRYFFGQQVIAFDLAETVKSLLLSSEWLNHVPTFNFALWFLPTYFITQVVFLLVPKKLEEPVILLLIGLLIPSCILFQALVPGRPILGINVVLPGITFMLIGKILAKRQNILAKWWKLTLAVSLSASVYVGIYIQGNIQAIGSPLYFIGATASTILLYFLVSQLKPTSFISWVGANSLIFYGLHGLVANTYGYVLLKVEISSMATGLLLWLLNLVYVLLLTALLTAGVVWARKIYNEATLLKGKK